MEERRQLKWEMLRTFQCPYDEEELIQDGDNVKCTVCRFKIDYEKYKSLLTHRSSPEIAGKIRHYWQNLKDNRCILCGNFLREAGQQYKVLKCMSPDCTFKISESTLESYTADKMHPMNRSYGDQAKK